MTMPFSFHDGLDSGETTTHLEFSSQTPRSQRASDKKIPLIAEKMRVPKFGDQISRLRINSLLKKSLEQIGAALVTGRAGTGKTSLAADFAGNYERVAWYSVEALDTDWGVFSQYFARILGKEELTEEELSKEILFFVEGLIAWCCENTSGKVLIVLDDIHSVFDADWFPEFFVSLLYSLGQEMHLLMLSRTKPAQPLWRLRSKQVLGVIDEKVLAFTDEEAQALFTSRGLSAEDALRAQKKCFGRVGKLISFIETAKK